MKDTGRRESPYGATDSSLSSDLGGPGALRGSSRSSVASSFSASPGGSANSPRGQDPMQYSDDEDEGKEGYKVGGYHAVKASEVVALSTALGMCDRLLALSHHLYDFPRCSTLASSLRTRMASLDDRTEAVGVVRLHVRRHLLDVSCGAIIANETLASPRVPSICSCDVVVSPILHGLTLMLVLLDSHRCFESRSLLRSFSRR